MITDLSFPPGQRVNDGIDPLLCSLSYTTVDKAAQIVSELGPGALLAKVDTESAYRLVPVHPYDRQLEAVQWEGEVFVDSMLPFSLARHQKFSMPLPVPFSVTFNSRVSITHILHYLDEFLIIGPPESSL